VVQAKSLEDKQAWVKAINVKMSDQVGDEHRALPFCAQDFNEVS
jgi:hypothetical protein